MKTRTTSGMTLIELLVVLALLGGLASIAVRTASTMNRRGRYDQTGSFLASLQDGVVGDGRCAGRFVRDMGRLPMVQTEADGEILSELWREPTGLAFEGVTLDMSDAWPEFTSDQSDVLPDTISILCGWNGPYVRVTDPARARLYDGFGNEWDVATNSTGEIVQVISRGAGGSEGAEWAEVDQMLDWDETLPATWLTVTVKARAQTQGTVWCCVEEGDDESDQPYQLDQLCVAVFMPEVSAIGKTIAPRLASPGVECGHVVSNLMPTACRVFAYGTCDSGLLISGAEPESVVLEPGQNFLTLYLKDPE